jgi:hypothetical protein
MKKIAVLSLAIPLLISVQSSKALTTNVDWTFENSIPATAGPFSPEVGTGSATGVHAGAAAYSSPAGDGSPHSFSANLWAIGDYYQFSTTLDLANYLYSGFNISYEQNGSATGPKTFDFAWSTDGTTFTQVGGDYALTSAITWSTASSAAGLGTIKSFDLSSATALNTASTVYFRIIENSPATGGAVNGGNVGTGGTDRVDDFLITSTITAVPEPTSIALAALGGFSILGMSIFRKQK